MVVVLAGLAPHALRALFCTVFLRHIHRRHRVSSHLLCKFPQREEEMGRN